MAVGPVYSFSFQPPKLDAGNDGNGSLRQHAAEIARSLRQFPEIVAALNAMSARIAVLEATGAGAAFLLEDGVTELWLEDSTPLLLEA